MGIRRGVLPWSQKSAYKFWFSQNLTTYSLLSTGSLTGNTNSQLTHIFYEAKVTESKGEIDQDEDFQTLLSILDKTIKQSSVKKKKTWTTLYAN